MVACIELPEETARAVTSITPGEMFGTWAVYRVKTKQEKAFSAYLSDREIQHFLPLVARKRSEPQPLWPSYVSVCLGGAEERYAAEKFKDRYEFVEIRNQRKFASHLDYIHRAVAANMFLERFNGIVEGQKCRVTKGPFMGTEGTVISAGDRKYFVIVIETLGAARTVDISPEHLEPIDG